MKKTKTAAPTPRSKSPGTRMVEKYRPRMNHLSEVERKRLLEEGLAIIYGATADRDHAHRR